MTGISARLCLRNKGNEDKIMGCCGSCGGEAPNHTNEPDESKEKVNDSTSKAQDKVKGNDKENDKEKQ